MSDERDNLVLVATFEDATEAFLARNRLEANGVRAVLGEENSANLGWALTGAKGGVKLLVADADLARSRYLLGVKPWLEPDDQEKTAIATAETLESIADEDEGPPSLREQQATRAFKSAVFGLLLPPLLFYAYYLLLAVVFTRGRLQGRPRVHAVLAAILLVTLIAVPVGLASVAYFAPPRKDPGLRLHAHPAVLVGKWQGKVSTKAGEANMVVELDGKGEMRYQLIGAADREWLGSWAFDNFSLYLQVEKVVHGDPPPAKIVAWELDRFARDELFLKDGRASLKLVRQ